MAQLRFGVDELGKEILELVPTPRVAERDTRRDVAHESDKPYKGDNTIVMMEWEKPYMRGLVDALRITEQTDVLEIGFGCGYSADRIQEMKPRSHTVVEPDPVVLGRLKAWAAAGGARQEGVKVVEGFWQTALPELGCFDAIFFDDFPLPGTPDSSDLRGPESRWHAFIDLCVAHHLHVGGRITGYLARPLCLARPGCDAAPLVPFPVEVPPNCSYFPYREAYIPLVTRRAEGVSEAGLGSKKGVYDASHPLVMDDRNPSSSSTTIRTLRKRQKRLLLEALVKERLGLGDGRGTGGGDSV